MKLNKRIYLAVTLIIFTMILSLSFSCNLNSNTEIQSQKQIKSTEPSTLNVKYVVIGDTGISGTYPVVSATYTNSQGGTEQISNLKLKDNPEEVMRNDVASNSTDTKVNIRGAIIANYKDFPINEFMYLSAQNELAYGYVMVCIIVNGKAVKSSLSKGAYAIAEANYYYYSK